jgi:hypothetical protein
VCGAGGVLVIVRCSGDGLGMNTQRLIYAHCVNLWVMRTSCTMPSLEGKQSMSPFTHIHMSLLSKSHKFPASAALSPQLLDPKLHLQHITMAWRCHHCAYHNRGPSNASSNDAAPCQNFFHRPRCMHTACAQCMLDIANPQAAQAEWKHMREMRKSEREEEGGGCAVM